MMYMSVWERLINEWVSVLWAAYRVQILNNKKTSVSNLARKLKLRVIPANASWAFRTTPPRRTHLYSIHPFKKKIRVMAFHMVLPQTYLPKPDTQPSTCRWNRNEPSIHQMEPVGHIGETSDRKYFPPYTRSVSLIPWKKNLVAKLNKIIYFLCVCDLSWQFHHQM